MSKRSFISKEKPGLAKPIYAGKREKEDPLTIFIQKAPPKKTKQIIGAKHLA
ncbi:hypothetical protein G9A89_016237 [Geosiphon pyriformis]|nr:hypothetical protein G9A89_016237 [Geosiphon pyriformis]